ncbi:MAG: ornithine carbamoyltransferase [Acidobacteriota bacterium]
MKDFLSLKSVKVDLWKQLLQVSSEVKERSGNFRQMLAGKSLVLLFEKASLRTRLTFELGMKQMGGDAVFFDNQESRLGERESLMDMARNLERWFDCIVTRTFSHDVAVELAEHASVPVINGLSDQEHPCQALADMFTLHEKWGDLEGRTIVFVGDGNNVCTSLIHAAALSGMSFVAVTPTTHEPYANAAEDFEALSTLPSASYQCTHSLEGLKGADAVYTDTWVSMGQEEDAKDRVQALKDYQITPEVMASAGKESFFMHCLPAHRNQEVTDAVIDSGQSLVYEQAENRLHAQKALILILLAPGDVTRYLQLEKFATWNG